MDWGQRVGAIRQWARGGRRAPHKPLLLLYALARWQREPDAALRYSEVEQDLALLLLRYGPPGRTTPVYPFHHLQSDGVWEVRTIDGSGSPGAAAGALRASGAAGRLAPGLREALAADPSLAPQLARQLLAAHFPPSLHADIAADTGLAPGWEAPVLPSPAAGSPAGGGARRSAELRREVLTAYEYRCAFCGFDGALAGRPVALEAAHVRWVAFEGPDTPENALCLCSLHHKLLDLGVLGLDDGRTITVSREFVARSDTGREQVVALAGREVAAPQAGTPGVASGYARWHAEQVFHGSPRTPQPV
ncbi:phosphorothioated DNA-binding restriction endonuclease [Streptomyces lonarensis]|uniref:Restriction endonuclease n=2 Tax=Streptomyces lonarensis TaxID=700599 RepID=A0A7X6D395_9ACTN|nr:HNH endonuclease [Streptomyces lonarensis]NJQ07401.1 restriction endonuclease [Streptomyces lonarensis]